jgi:hypothetical protein
MVLMGVIGNNEFAKFGVQNLDTHLTELLKQGLLAGIMTNQTLRMNDMMLKSKYSSWYNHSLVQNLDLQIRMYNEGSNSYKELNVNFLDAIRYSQSQLEVLMFTDYQKKNPLSIDTDLPKSSPIEHIVQHNIRNVILHRLKLSNLCLNSRIGRGQSLRPNPDRLEESSDSPAGRNGDYRRDSDRSVHGLAGLPASEVPHIDETAVLVRGSFRSPSPNESKKK